MSEEELESQESPENDSCDESETESYKNDLLTLATHDGGHHMDDAMATAIILLCLGRYNVRVIRTKDPEALTSADILVDVGKVYDPDNLRFDHHQESGGSDLPQDSKRPRGFASAGLVWLHFGRKAVTKCLGLQGDAEPDEELVCRVVEGVDRALMVPIDNWDNGLDRGFSGIPVQFMASAMSFRRAVHGCTDLLTVTIGNLVNREAFRRDILTRLHSEEGPRLWDINGNLILCGSEDQRVDLGAADEVIRERYGKSVLGVISVMKGGRWVLILSGYALTSSGKSSVRIKFEREGLDVHPVGSMIFDDSSGRLLDIARYITSTTGALRSMGSKGWT